MKTIIIQGEKFEISEPYAEGHVCTAAEAKALNQVRAENIGNNLRKKVTQAKEAGTFDQEEMQKLVTQYDSEYVFEARVSTGGTRRVLDPVEREARRIARDIVKAHLERQGVKLKDVPKEALDEKIDELSARDEIIAEAKKAVKAQDKLKEQLASVGDL